MCIRDSRNSHWIVGGCTQDYGSMTLMPVSGTLKYLPQDRGSLFSHKEETATPAYYSVLHGENGIALQGRAGPCFHLQQAVSLCGQNADVYKRQAYKRGAFFANPCFTQIHPTCIPVKGDYQSKLTLMSESLRNSGRIWVRCV